MSHKALVAGWLLLGSLVTLWGCGGDELTGNADATLDLSSTSAEYNGYFGDFEGDLDRDIDDDQTTLTVVSGFRRFRIILAEDVLKKGQIFQLDDPNDARATYDEGSDKVWVAFDGRAEVTDELLGKFTIRLRDLRFTAADDEENEALGDFELDGSLRRR